MDMASGAADLLPPSPSVVSPISRPFTHHPLNISSSSSNAAEHAHPHQDASPIPPHGDGYSHTQPHLEPLKSPVIRPLDFMAFVASSAETHVELARTVDELSRWLAVVEGGLAGVLEKASMGTEERDVMQEGGRSGEGG